MFGSIRVVTVSVGIRSSLTCTGMPQGSVEIVVIISISTANFTATDAIRRT